MIHWLKCITIMVIFMKEMLVLISLSPKKLRFLPTELHLFRYQYLVSRKGMFPI